jgi:hypothetical protein
MVIRLRTAIVLGLSLLAVVAVGGASANNSASSARALNFQVVVRDALLTYVDLGPEGPSVGDMLVKNSRLFNRTDTRRVGRSPISCVVVDLQRPPRCNADAVLRRGTIALQGVLTQPRFVLAVTGGTGAFQNVRGEAHGRVIRGGNRVRLTFHLRGVRRR